MHTSIVESIGNTPLVELTRYREAHNLPGRIAVKREAANPFGSIKDRAALVMILAAEADGLLRPGSVIIEPTSGNAGIGLAAVGAARGYRVILTMPETMTRERRQLLAAHGAELVLTDGKKGMAGAIAKARELLEATANSFMPDQFNNPANARAHYAGTGPEIWRDTDGGVDAFVAGVGSGGTVTGVGRFLKEKRPGVHIVAVEPAASPVLSGGSPGPHGIQGIGAGFVPGVFDRAVVDDIVTVTDDDARAAVRAVRSLEGLLVGVSGGANLAAAVRLAEQAEWRDRLVVTVFPDSGEKYLSQGLFGTVE
ncbi:MAG: cysteine synthase A [Planctomycetaceae bacterium]|nr:cysteine synthase A [Planctomycetaceae bacterium]